MVRIGPLSDEQRQALERVRRRAVGRVSQRAHMVLLSARDYTVEQIGEIVGVGEDVVRKWLHRYQREGPTGLDDRGCFHYWADTYRPAAKPEQKPEVFAYNQGLVAVAMRCLERMGVAVDGHLVRGVEHAYATMTSPHDYATLPQRAGAAILDVSSLTGEALSLHWFDRSLLGPGRVVATLRAFKRCEHRDGDFLGFRVISNPDGSCRPDEEFIVPISNPPGYYHNGGSWLLYDALALYVAARHGIEGAPDLFVQRLRSEVKYEQESHEYLSTSPDQLGQGEPRRARYGWNSFVWRLFT